MTFDPSLRHSSILASPIELILNLGQDLTSGCCVIVEYKVGGSKSGGGAAKICTLLIIIPLRAYLAI